MNYLFLGTGNFAAAVYHALQSKGRAPEKIFTSRTSSGSPSSLEAAALKSGKGVTLIEDENFAELLGGILKKTVVLVTDYGRKIPSPLLGASDYGLWNLHPSLLPRWRGAAPIVRAIMAGDQKTGICLMLMNEGIDKGDLIDCVATEISSKENAGELSNRLARMGAELFLKTLEGLDNFLQARGPIRGGGLLCAQVEKIRVSPRLGREFRKPA